MPRVDWPTKRKRGRRFLLVSSPVALIVSVVLTSFFTIVSPSAAQAADALPDNTLNSNNMTLVISQSTNPAVINAPQDYVKIYLYDQDTGVAKFNIWNAPFYPCADNRSLPDWYSPGMTCSSTSTADNRTVLYDFFAMDANEDAPQPNPFSAMTYLYTLNGQTGDMTGTYAPAPNISVPHGGWSGDIDLPTGAPTQISKLTGYRVIVMRARYKTGLSTADCGTSTDPCVTRLHSYKIRGANPSDELGYWEAAPGSPPADGQYIVHYLGANCDNVPSDCNMYIDHTEFDFAPGCDVFAPETATLKWFDADNDPWFYLYEYNAAGTLMATKYVGPVGSGTSPDIGANNEYRQWSFTANPGWKYRWVWHHLNAPFGSQDPWGPANNIQMWMPYDSINYNIQCFNYHDKIAPIDGKINGQTLDFSNPADTHVAFRIDGINLVDDALPLPTATTTDFMSPIYGFPDTSATACAGAPCKRNINIPIPGPATITGAGSFAYTLNPLTPTGTVLCFKDHITPHMMRGDPGIDSDNQICYKVKNNRDFPAAVGQNGDVHAGGGKCVTGPFSTGFIKGNMGNEPAGGSLGQYAVSAYSTLTGTINDFGSNNAVFGTANDKLRIGNAGAYGQVCRPDMVTAATTYRTANPGAASVGPGDYDISGWSDVMYIDGDANIHGTVNNKLTIVSTAGNLNITGTGIKLNYGALAAGRAQPSLGIIAANNIDISRTVTQVDAYLFADGTIDTCIEGVSSKTACSTPPLLVNGFLMAHDLALHRVGIATSGSPTTEKVVLNPQLYLNPPRFFDAASTGNNALLGQGEKPPLY